MTNRILIIEDDAKITDSLVRGLGEEGYIVGHAGDAPAGEQAVTEHSWDLIILDWSLPGGDGLALLRSYRARGGDTPVLFLTARDAVSDRVRGLDGGADDYVCKPFAFDELLARVRALTRRTSRASTGALSYFDVHVDPLSGRAERHGKSLELTPKELALLSFFIRHPNEVLSRTRIYEHVWEGSYEGLSNTLEYHVVELRKKLEALGPRLIHTVRRKGYSFGDAPDDAP